MNGRFSAPGASRAITAARLGPLQSQQRAVVELGHHLVRQAVGEMGQVGGAARRVDHQMQPALGSRHHQVVDDAARLVGQQGVAHPTDRQALDVAGHQPLERRRGALARDRHLAHVRDVEQRRPRPGACEYARR